MAPALAPRENQLLIRLHRAGLIDYQRGHITVLDRLELERRTCECYSVVKKEYDRLLRAIPAG
jgi:hypothetical protein